MADDRFPLECVCTGPGRCPARGCDVTAGVQAACRGDERFRWALSGRPRAEWPEHVRNPAAIGGPSKPRAAAAGRPGRAGPAVRPPAHPPGRGDCVHLGAVSYPCPLGDPSRDVHFCDCPELAEDFGRCWGSPRKNEAKDVASCAGCRHHDDGRAGPLEREMRDALRAALRDACDASPPPLAGEGRGVVQCVGGSLYARLAFVSARVLRASGCTLPIEWWHLGRHEWDTGAQRLADAVGARVVDASAVAARLPVPPRPPLRGPRGGWVLKAFSVLHSGFAEALCLDADNLVVRDPSFLFEDPRYRRRGAAFWPDTPPAGGPWVPDRAWRAAGMDPWPDLPALESGQFLVDRRRCGPALRLAWVLNDYADFWYQLVYGDKDTFALAFSLATLARNEPRPGYHLAPRAAYTDPFIRQLDFDGRPLFQHNVSGKRQILAGAYADYFARPADIRAAAAELPRLWDGRLWHAREQDAAEDELARSVCGRWLITAGGRGGPLTHAPAGTVGRGRDGGGLARRWSLRLLGGEPTLILLGPGHKNSEIVMAFLTPGAGGRWRGRLEYHGREEVTLEADE